MLKKLVVFDKIFKFNYVEIALVKKNAKFGFHIIERNESVQPIL